MGFTGGREVDYSGSGFKFIKCCMESYYTYQLFIVCVIIMYEITMRNVHLCTEIYFTKTVELFSIN